MRNVLIEINREGILKVDGSNVTVTIHDFDCTNSSSNATISDKPCIVTVMNFKDTEKIWDRPGRYSNGANTKKSKEEVQFAEHPSFG